MIQLPTITSLVSKMTQQIASFELRDPLIIGIHTGGAWVADKIHQQLHSEQMPTLDRPSTLDISFYRDDFSRVGLNPEVRASSLPDNINDRNIILIDDVLYTGRTIRAAMNEIFSYGRPAQVTLGVLIERTGRELPIQADVVGHSLQLPQNKQVKLINTDGNLQLHIIEAERDNQ